MNHPVIPISRFRRAVYGFYVRHGRNHLPWRHTTNPYHILVSEIMLQQTQVARVTEKYTRFIARFPTIASLAQASLSHVLKEWQGLGYNRRALYLKRLAEEVCGEFGGTIPRERGTLRTLPGIGDATSGSICAFAFNSPEIFIETNIRSVFLHHFFPGKTRVDDSLILPLVEKTLDRKHPCRWYSALMDYGTHLKKLHDNPSRISARYKSQGVFAGSDRQMASQLLKRLLELGTAREQRLLSGCNDNERARRQLARLVREGFAEYDGKVYRVR